MSDKFITRLADIMVANSAALIAGGTAWGTPYAGVIRVNTDPNPQAGYINIYERSYEQSSSATRPAIYFGNKGMDFEDTITEVSMSSVRSEYRMIKIPIVVVALDPKPVNARKQRDQIATNLRKIMLQPSVLYDSAGNWYLLECRPSGSVPMRGSTSTSGNSSQNAAESIVLVPLEISYVFNPSSTA